MNRDCKDREKSRDLEGEKIKDIQGKNLRAKVLNG